MRRNDPPGARRLPGEVDKILLELLGSDRMPRYGKPRLRPNADVYFDASAAAVVVKLELAGVDPSKIDLEIEDRVLTVRGVRLDERHPDAVYQQMEIDYGQFERSVPLPQEADPTQATANYCAGFLEIVIPVRPRSTSKRIPITMKDDDLTEIDKGGQTS